LNAQPHSPAGLFDLIMFMAEYIAEDTMTDICKIVPVFVNAGFKRFWTANAFEVGLNHPENAPALCASERFAIGRELFICKARPA
jgi:hypothetical protein